jgi:transcriptional regulator with GAF, ATPase, and Fis domain
MLTVSRSEFESAAPPTGTPVTLEEAEREHILRTLEQTGWVIGGPQGAAARLGLKRTTLFSTMRRLGISRQAVSQHAPRTRSSNRSARPGSTHPD